MEPLFYQYQPLTCVLKTARQVSKTTSAVAQTILQCATIDNFTTMIVAPLEQQSLRISSLFVRPFLDSSPLLKIVGLDTERALHFKFENNSAIILSYAHQDADRTRGVPADKVHVDEVQDIRAEFIPVISAALSASRYKFSVYTGTPKNYNNTLQFLWQASSQAEWAIKCAACNYWNIASAGNDLLQMIGPPRPDISYENPGTICAKCGSVIHPATGRWVHSFPDRMFDYAGYHIPQPIMEMHYADPVAWKVLYGKMQGGYQTSTPDFYREILGEAYDTGTHLLTLEDITKVAVLPNRNDEAAVMDYVRNSKLRVLGIDWGGGGKEGNYTTLSLCCLGFDGRIYVPWGIALRTPHDHIREAVEIIRIANRFGVDFIAHDFTGAGSLRETVLVHNGFPRDRIIPYYYVAFSSVKGSAAKFVPADKYNPRSTYHIDPTRAMLLVTGAIKLGKVQFFKYDYMNENDPGLLHHFLSLVEDVNFPAGHKSYRVVCEQGYRDEFAQATMLGCVCLWCMTSWPEYAVEP